jgi:hypothetical protein
MQSTATQIHNPEQIRQTQFDAYEDVDRLLDLGENLNRVAACEVAAIDRNLKLILSGQNPATA